MKKILALLLAVMMVVGLFAACACAEKRSACCHTPKAFLTEFRRLDNGKGNNGAASGAV